MSGPGCRRAAAAMVLMVVLVGGGSCSEPKPAQPIGTDAPGGSMRTTTPTGAASIASSATTTVPEATTWTTPALPRPRLPEVANLPTAEGAQAFVRYWYDELNYAIATGDTSGLIAVSHPKCTECLDVIDQIGDLYGSGGHQEGNAYAISVIDVSPPDENGVATVTYRETRSSGTEVQGNGNRVVEGVRDRTIGAVATFGDGRWLFVGIGSV